MALQYITKEMLKRESGGAEDGAVLFHTPYDITFLAGWDSNMQPADIEVRTYGEMIMCRPGLVWGDVFYIQVAPQVSQFHVDVLKNGTTIHDYWFPGCNATNQGRGNQGEYTGAHTGSGGGPENYISGVTMPFVSGDRFTFKVTSIGSAADPGQGLRFTLKCLV